MQYALCIEQQYFGPVEKDGRVAGFGKKIIKSSLQRPYNTIPNGFVMLIANVADASRRTVVRAYSEIIEVNENDVYVELSSMFNSKVQFVNFLSLPIQKISSFVSMD